MTTTENPQDVLQEEVEGNRFLQFVADNTSETDENFEKETTPRKPTRGRRASTAKPSKPMPRWKDGQIAQFVERVYKTAGGMLLLNPDPEIRIIAQTIIQCAEQAGIAWEKVAKRHEVIRRMFDRLMTTSDLGELFWAHVPILVPVLRKFGPFRGTIEGLEDEFASEFDAAGQSAETGAAA